MSFLILILYFLSFHFVPPLLRATLAICWLAVHISQKKFGSSLHLGILGLLILSLPIVASLQFFLGYPIRLITTKISVELLNLIGYAVKSQGTLMHWAGELVAVDTPCAGIRMLWCALYTSFALSCFFKLSFFHTWINYLLTALIVFLANIIRTTALFLLESRIISFPFPAHYLIGILTFSLAILLVLTFSRRMQKYEMQRLSYAN